MTRAIDAPSHLVSLLHLRGVWDLSGPAGLPAVSPPAGESEPIPAQLTGEQVEAAWTALWEGGIAWRDDGFPPATFPPYWRDRFGPTGFEEKARTWVNGRCAELRDVAMNAETDTRLRTVLDEAEEQGVRCYVLLPLAEPWARWTSEDRVVMSGLVLTDEQVLRRFTRRPS